MPAVKHLILCLLLGSFVLCATAKDTPHSLCNANHTLPWVSWCEYNNPTIVPLPLNLTFYHFLNATPACVSSDIYSPCAVVSNVAIVQTNMNYTKLYFSYEDGCLQFGQLDAEVELSAECVSGSTISNFATLFLPSNISVIAYGRNTNVNGSIASTTVTVRATIIEYDFPWDYVVTYGVAAPVVYTYLVLPDPASNQSDTTMLAVSVLKSNTTDYLIDFTLVDIHYLAYESLATWRIANPSNSTLNFDVTCISTDFVVSGKGDVLSYLRRNIIMVYDNNSVNLIVLDSEMLSGDISLGPESDNVTVFYSLPQNITVGLAKMWSEPLPRYLNSSTIYPSTLLWVLFGASFPQNNSHTLIMVAFTMLQNNASIKAGNFTYFASNLPTLFLPVSEQVSSLDTRYVPKYDEFTMEVFNIDFALNNSWLNHPHTELFVGFSRSLDVFAIQIYEDTQSDILIDTLNSLPFIGSFKNVFVSNNAQHVFTAVTRQNWELVSMDRFYNICTTLATSQDPNTLQFLQPYADQCAQGYREANFMDFMQYVGVCLTMVQCPSFDSLNVRLVPRGYYTQNSFLAEQCEPGTFCVSGIKQACPKGFICPVAGLSSPEKCPLNPYYNTTCFADGLAEPLPCADGMSCPTPYYPGLPSPPGFCAPEGSRTSFTACNEGDYCSLGMACDSSYRPCPLGTFCYEPDVLTPQICSCSPVDNQCSYCKPGSFAEIPCPAGTYCPGPNATVPCEEYQYCPAGRFSAVLCPAGYYCPSPAQSHICPHRYFCPEGSISPKKCSLFSHCPAGSSAEKGNYGMPLYGAIFIIVVVIAWKGFTFYQAKQALLPKAAKKEEDTPLLYTPAVEGLQKKSFTIDIEFAQLGLTIKDKTVLSGVTGSIRHGRVTAVMGPSGAGKTTFLTTLADKVTVGKVTGGIYINGRKGSLGEYKEIVGFVPQEDIMLRMMTVEEILMLAAKTRLPAGMSDMLREKQVNAVIDVLGLKDVRGSIIGDEVTRGVSGGQRKRVNIGMELVADPTVLFLDEPTSGLDSTSSREVLAALRKIAGLGITIATVIHQPRYEIFTMFHDVLLLGKGGKTVYLGESARALEYFEMLGFHCPALVNPPDFFLDVISGEVDRDAHPDFVPADLFQLWNEHKDRYQSAPSALHNQQCIPSYNSVTDTKESEIPEKTSNYWPEALSCSTANRTIYRVTPGFLVQFLLFLKRALIQQSRTAHFIALDMLLVASSGLFLGIIFSNTQYQGPPSSALCERLVVTPLIERCELPLDDPIGTIASLTCLSVSLTAVASSLRIFGNEKVVYWRESSWGLNTLAYFLGKDFAQVPNMLLQPLVFLAVYSTIVATQAPFWDVYFIILIVQFASVGIGYLVSILINSSLSQLVGVVFVLVSMMFSGARPTLKELSQMIFPLPIMPYFSFIRWAQEAFYLTEISEYKAIYNVQTGMDIWSYKFSNYKLDIAMVVLLGFTFRLAGLLLLFVLDRQKKK